MLPLVIGRGTLHVTEVHNESSHLPDFLRLLPWKSPFTFAQLICLDSGRSSFTNTPTCLVLKLYDLAADVALFGLANRCGQTPSSAVMQCLRSRQSRCGNSPETPDRSRRPNSPSRLQCNPSPFLAMYCQSVLQDQTGNAEDQLFGPKCPSTTKHPSLGRGAFIYLPDVSLMATWPPSLRPHRDKARCLWQWLISRFYAKQVRSTSQFCSLAFRKIGCLTNCREWSGPIQPGQHCLCLRKL